MLWAVFCLFGLLALALALCLLLQKPLADCLPLGAFGAILLLYLAGLAGQLRLGIAAVGLAVLALCVLAGRAAAQRPAVLRPQLAAGLRQAGLFMLPSALLLCLSWGRISAVWDDLSHWGRAVRDMMAWDKLACIPQATTTYKGYPPASSLFEYLFARYAGPAAESAAIFALGVLLCACMMPCLRRCAGRGWWLGFFAWLPLFGFAAVFFEKAYRMLYVDLLLGLLFADLLFHALREPTPTPFDGGYILLESAVLCLTKETGIALCGFAAAILLANAWLCRPKRAGRAGRAQLLLGPAALLAGLLAKQSWTIYRNLFRTGDAWDTSAVTLPALQRVLSGQLADYQRQCIATFRHYLFTSKRYILWIAGFLLLLAVWGWWTGRKKTAGTAAAGLLLSFAAFALSLLVLYLFTFTPEEAAACASMNRYLYNHLLGAWYLGMFLLLDHAFAAGVPQKARAACLGGLAAAFCGAAVLLGTPAYIGSLLPPFCFAETRQANAARDISAGLRACRDQLGREDTVLILAQDAQGQPLDEYSALLLSYEASPAHAVVCGEDLGPEQLTQRLAGCGATCLYLYSLPPALQAAGDETLRPGGFYRLNAAAS